MKKVLGKELILTEDGLKKIFKQVFGENLLVHDVWYEPNVGIHFKVGKITSKGNKNLENQGFEVVTDPANYPVKEEIDDRIEQLAQCEKILDREW